MTSAHPSTTTLEERNLRTLRFCYSKPSGSTTNTLGPARPELSNANDNDPVQRQICAMTASQATWYSLVCVCRSWEVVPTTWWDPQPTSRKAINLVRQWRDECVNGVYRPVDSRETVSSTCPARHVNAFQPVSVAIGTCRQAICR